VPDEPEDEAPTGPLPALGADGEVRRPEVDGDAARRQDLVTVAVLAGALILLVGAVVAMIWPG
jgi:hypothetical protein